MISIASKFGLKIFSILLTCSSAMLDGSTCPTCVQEDVKITNNLGGQRANESEKSREAEELSQKLALVTL